MELGFSFKARTAKRDAGQGGSRVPSGEGVCLLVHDVCTAWVRQLRNETGDPVCVGVSKSADVLCPVSRCGYIRASVCGRWRKKKLKKKLKAQRHGTKRTPSKPRSSTLKHFRSCLNLVLVYLRTINPFTAPARKISGLKDAGTRLQTVYFPVL